MAGAALIIVGTGYAVWPNLIASFYRNQVSRVLPRRYWIFLADVGRVRFMGVAAIISGFIFVSCSVVQLVAGTA